MSAGVLQSVAALSPELSAVLDRLTHPIRVVWDAWWESDIAERHPPMVIVAGPRASVRLLAPGVAGNSPVVVALVPRAVVLESPQLDPPDAEQIRSATYDASVPVVIVVVDDGWSLVELHPIPTAQA